MPLSHREHWVPTLDTHNVSVLIAVMSRSLVEDQLG